MIDDHVSRIKQPTEDKREVEIEENFPDEPLFQVIVQVPWYADLVKYLACVIMPPEFTYQQKRKLRTDVRFYI